MTLKRELLRVGLCVAAFAVTINSASICPAEPPLVTKLTSWVKGHGQQPATKEDKALEALAAHVDWLEVHLNNWGSVSAKAPDVWGEARLTQYRIEIEQQFKSRIGGFDENRLHGAQTISDAAMLAAAFALKSQPPIPSTQTRIGAPNVSVTTSATAASVASGNPSANINSEFNVPTPGVGIANILGDEKVKLEQTEVLNQMHRYLQHLSQIRRMNEGDDTSDAPGYSMNLVRIPISILPGTLSKRGYGAEITVTASPYLGPELLPSTFRDLIVNDLNDQLSIPLARFLNSNPNRADLLLSHVEAKRGEPSTVSAFGPSTPELTQTAETVQIEQFAKKFSSVCGISLAGSTSRRAQMPFPPTQLVDVYGFSEVGTIALTAWQAFREDVPNKRIVHATDTRAFLSEEIGAAVEVLNSDIIQQWWQRESTGERQLYNWIRFNRVGEIAEYRNAFIASIGSTGRNRVTPLLTWALFVNSILLNERLVDDIRQTTGSRPCGCQCNQWMAFFGPTPSEEARWVFAEYVRCRWPVRVFALDPSIDQQAIGDASSVYRQMQMAVVLAFAGGDIGISSAMDTMRKLQRDRATIDLNRTAVAFGHGDNTFGWRFQPRFQTPPVEGNAKVLFRDLIAGGPTDRQLEKSAEIEAGMRECTAVVLMPSFVPYVTFETRGNWYKLNRPGHTGTSIQDDVQMSRAIKQMQDSALSCVNCRHLYREGEVERVLARVSQLEHRLPLQTLSCQVPIENTHGGFEILCDGTRELAPELVGWYGAPGYSQKNGATFFLAGDNFNIKDSHIVAGNRSLTTDEIKLISRQLVEVKLPAGLPILTDTLLRQHNPAATFPADKYGDRNIYDDVRYGGWLDVHVATPYGASGRLLIPVVKPEVEPENPPTTDKPTTVSIQSVSMRGIMAVDKQKSLVSITPSTAMLPPILLPSGSQVGVTSRTIRLYPKIGSDAFAPVVFKDVSLNPNRSGYQIPADVYLDMLSTRGDLFKALKTYLPFGIATKTIDLSKPPIEITFGFTVEFEKVEVPVSGEIVLALDLTQSM
jgi:hypothetical protein